MEGILLVKQRGEIVWSIVSLCSGFSGFPASNLCNDEGQETHSGIEYLDPCTRGRCAGMTYGGTMNSYHHRALPIENTAV